MGKIIKVAIVLTCIALVFVVTAVPVMAAPGGEKGPPDKTTIVAPTTGGPENGTVKAPGPMIPDKSTHPVFDANPAFGGEYPGEGESSDPGKVFWDEDSGGGAG